MWDGISERAQRSEGCGAGEDSLGMEKEHSFPSGCLLPFQDT